MHDHGCLVEELGDLLVLKVWELYQFCKNANQCLIQFRQTLLGSIFGLNYTFKSRILLLLSGEKFNQAPVLIGLGSIKFTEFFGTQLGHYTFKFG